MMPCRQGLASPPFSAVGATALAHYDTGDAELRLA